MRREERGGEGRNTVAAEMDSASRMEIGVKRGTL